MCGRPSVFLLHVSVIWSIRHRVWEKPQMVARRLVYSVWTTQTMRCRRRSLRDRFGSEKQQHLHMLAFRFFFFFRLWVLWKANVFLISFFLYCFVAFKVFVNKWFQMPRTSVILKDCQLTHMKDRHFPPAQKGMGVSEHITIGHDVSPTTWTSRKTSVVKKKEGNDRVLMNSWINTCILCFCACCIYLPSGKVK